MKAKKIIFPLLALVLVCLYPCAFQYFRNAEEALPGDMLPMLGLFGAIGVVILLLGIVIFRSVPKAGLFASIAMVAVVNGGLVGALLKRVFPWMRDRYGLIALAVILLALLC